MAATPEGRAWVVKALHPSDPISDVRGIPDESSCPTVLLTYNSVFRAQAPVIAGSTVWGFDLTIVPDVINQASLVTLDGAGLPVTPATVGYRSFLNQGLRPPGIINPTYGQLMTQWRSMGVEAHRLVYYGVTAYQDGPALANQGTLVAAQWEVARRKYGIGVPPVAVTSGFTTFRGADYQQNDFSDYATSQFMPNAYFGESREGCYLPLRLTSTSQKWTTEADYEFPVGSWGRNALGTTLSTPIAASAVRPQPYPDLVQPYAAGAGAGMTGDVVFRPLNGIWGGISARNLSTETSFAFYFRVAVECRVQPASLLASQVHMSPPYDPVAVASYFRINRELKDAYPADFNDLGKIWDVIKKVANVVLPVVSAMGPVGAAGSLVGRAVISAIDSAPRSKRGAPGNAKGSDRPPAAAVERAQKQQVVRDAAVVKASNPPKRGKKSKKQKNIVGKKRGFQERPSDYTPAMHPYPYKA